MTHAFPTKISIDLVSSFAEPRMGLVLDVAKIKTLTGNDTINTRFLNENSFDYKPQFKIYINTNHLPIVNDVTVLKVIVFISYPLNTILKKEVEIPD